MSQKPRSGRCSICGCPMLVPGICEIKTAQGKHSELAELWVQGHRYIWDVETDGWHLDTVRCIEHVEHASDPRKYVNLRSE